MINHKDGPPAILRNDTPTANHWVRFVLVGTRSPRDAVGTRIEVQAGDRVIYRLKKSGHSLMSSHDPRILVGLGSAKIVTRVTVRWPSGTIMPSYSIPRRAGPMKSSNRGPGHEGARTGALAIPAGARRAGTGDEPGLRQGRSG